ncbi:uncharacterized protein LOC112051831 isoform X2 [Bicyclus anynana]|nr:uncharacterized protein LOC112051831 isoform X2 [Bicyclus anynana]
MKVACNFKKTCRNSDKKLKNYLANKEAGDAVDFCTFLKNNDESLKFRLPMYAGNSTPANRNKDDDNESTCTSIQNFMTDILKSEEIPDSEARIIKEVIEEETDILDDSLDSHWLQDDMSIDTDFRLDFSFSPFSTPRSTIDDPYTPKKVQNNTTALQEQNVPVKKEFDDQTYMENINPNIQNDSHKIKKENVEDLESCDVDTNLENVLNNSANKGSLYNLFPTPPIIPNISAPPTPLIKSILFGDKLDIDTQSRPNHVYVPTELNSNITSEKRIEEKDKSGEKCVIDLNLENALKNDSAKKVMLDDLLATPPVIPNISAPPTPLIKNILFGNKIDIENRPKNVYVPRPDENDIDGLYEEFCKISDQDLIIKEEFYIKEENSDHEYIIKKGVNVNKPVKTTETLNESNEDKYCLKEFLCKICDRKFKHVMALKVHCVSAHKFKIASAKRKSVRKKMICDYCGKVFMSSRCIVRHIQKHMEPDKYDCDRCPLSFRTVTGLKAHQSTHGIVHKGSNNKKRNYICTVCGAVQNSSSNHNIHMRRHNNTYTITCTVCGKGFYRTSDLDVHMRMPNKRLLWRKIGNHTEEDMKKALQDIRSGKKIRAVARELKIPFSTLQRYAAKVKASTSPENVRLVPHYDTNRVFTDEQEQALKEYYQNCALMFYGLTTKDCRTVAYEMAVLNKIKIPQSWDVNKMAGIDWLKSFRQRHSELSLRKPEACSLARATSFNKEVVKAFFDKLQEVYKRHTSFADGTRVYNLDETATTTVQKPQNVIGPKGKNIGKVTSGEKGTLVTTCCFISAAGQALPPVLIFPRKNYKDHMIKGTPPGTLGLANPSGRMNSELFVKTMRHFIKHTSSSKENASLIIMDTHESHLCIEAIDLAKENGVTILTLHPHISAKMQPLDVGIFSPFKSYYNAAMDSWLLNNPGKNVTIYDLAEFIGTAFTRAMTPMNIINAFRKTGIYPFDRNVFTDEDFLPSAVTDRLYPDVLKNVPDVSLQDGRVDEQNRPSILENETFSEILAHTPTFQQDPESMLDQR